MSIEVVRPLRCAKECPSCAHAAVNGKGMEEQRTEGQHGVVMSGGSCQQTSDAKDADAGGRR
jgi:hypothetical protein